MSKPSSARDVNVDALGALKRLSTALAELDDTSTSNKLSHWRGDPLPDDVETSYRMLSDGAELVKAASTKYTLVGKINFEDGAKLAEDLRKGCELIGTGALILHSPPTGCARSTRHFVKRSSRAVIATVITLIECFLDGTALGEGKETVGAQRTGAVWSACDAIVGGRVPRGNRSAMRRELLTWAAECNETMEEFKDVIELGPSSESESSDGINNEGISTWDDFCGAAAGTGDQYTTSELQVAKSCLALMKCSRGTIGAAIKASECAGDEVGRCDGDGDLDGVSAAARKEAVLQWISNLHDMARKVGEGVTDLGILLYPPLDLVDIVDEGEGETGEESKVGILAQAMQQRDAVLAVNEYIMEAMPPRPPRVDATEDQGGESDVGGSEVAQSGSVGGIISMSDEIVELVTKLRAAGDARFQETEAALRCCTK